MAEDTQKVVEIERTRTLSSRLARIVTVTALVFAAYQILFVYRFLHIFIRFLRDFGIDLEFLRITFQSQQNMAFVLTMVLILAFLLYPSRKKAKYFQGVQRLDGLLLVLGVASTLYIFAIFPRYATFARVTLPDVIFGVIALITILEATRRSLGWMLPAVCLGFLVFGIIDLGFRWPRFVQQLALDEGIMGIPMMVMVNIVFAFIFFGSFLLKIGIGQYITGLMIAIFGPRSGGPAKAAVFSSALMGTMSGSSVANTLTTGTFTIPLMKQAGYPREIAGAVEPVASTGGQLMPPIMGAAAFIMAEFLGIPYRMIIIAAIVPSLIYYAGVYAFVDLETRRLKLRGIPRLTPLVHFLKKIYLLLPLVVITVALLSGIPPHICALASIGLAVWAAWIAKDTIEGSAAVYVPALLITTVLMFIGEGSQAALALSALALVLVGLSFTTKLVKPNEKLYMSLLFILFIALSKQFEVVTTQILLITGILGIAFSLVVGARAKGEEGREMYVATHEALTTAATTSVPIMLAAASAGLIQAVLTMTGLITKIGYDLVALTGGVILLLLPLCMVFSIILGMGVPTTAKYIITSLVFAPAILLAVGASTTYGSPVPGYTVAIGLLAAHFFVLYFAVLADVTPPVALASYAGATIAGGNFWQTAKNALKYALAGFIAPYIIFLHPEMLLITVETWNALVVLQVLFDIAGAVLAMYLLAAAITGWSRGYLRTGVRVLLGATSLTIALTFQPIAIIAGVLALVALRFAGAKSQGVFFRDVT